MSENAELTQVRKMLTALLKSNNQIHWIGGYAPGKTSKGDPFIILYPAGDHLEHQVCRVYKHDLGKLPQFISREIPEGVNGEKKAPSRPEAQAKGIYRDCPRFCVLTYHGKETQMGREIRFSDTLFVPPQN